MKVNNRPFGLLSGLGFVWVIGLYSCKSAYDETIESIALKIEAREIAFAISFADRDLDVFLGFVSPYAIFFMGTFFQARNSALFMAAGPG